MITPRDRILITGANGALGEAVVSALAVRCHVIPTDINVRGSLCAELDVSSRASVRAVCAEVRPTVIVNLAAITDLEECERSPAVAYEINAWAVHLLVREARARGIPFIHISTAGVFDGTRESYTEDDAHEANPSSVYGKSKYMGELAARAYSRSIVLRSGWMIGGGPLKDKKFVNKVITQIRSGVREVRAVHDKAGTPSYTYDVARLMIHLLDTGQYGLYHACCAGSGSRVAVAESIVQAFGLSGTVSVTPVDSSYFSGDYSAPRPPSEVISNDRARALLPASSRHFKECIAEYAKKFDWGLPLS